MRLSWPAIAAAIALATAGCPDTSSWELRGEVRFIELRESLDASGAKKACLEYSIQNRGRSTIGESCIALTFSTDKNRYHLTVLDANAIRRGALVYGQVSIAYNEADEVGVLAGAVVDSVQFK